MDSYFITIPVALVVSDFVRRMDKLAYAETNWFISFEWAIWSHTTRIKSHRPNRNRGNADLAKNPYVWIFHAFIFCAYGQIKAWNSLQIWYRFSSIWSSHSTDRLGTTQKERSTQYSKHFCWRHVPQMFHSSLVFHSVLAIYLIKCPGGSRCHFAINTGDMSGFLSLVPSCGSVRSHRSCKIEFTS